MIFDDTQCHLGEGLLWHPLREELFWFDINARTLYAKKRDQRRQWSFDTTVSAAGWASIDTLIIASDIGLNCFDIGTGTLTPLSPIEETQAQTRSNDGRADPNGGFWFGTMGRKAEAKAGSIYRFYKGEIRKLYGNLTIPNAICFQPDGQTAYFADTAQGIVWHVSLDHDGWPKVEPEIYLDCKSHGLNPDGAVIDTQGHMWLAQWGAHRVATYDRLGAFQTETPLPAAHITCPGFGGDDMQTLFVTSAREGLEHTPYAHQKDAGKTFAIKVDVAGQKEHRVLI